MQTYQIAQYINLVDLEERVNSDMKNGWKPLGGVQTLVMPPQAGVSYEHYIVYSQAMVREVVGDSKVLRGKR